VKQEYIEQINNMTPNGAVNTLVDAPNSNPAPPINYYESFQPDNGSVALGDTWVNAPYDPIGTVNYYRFLSLQSWWIQNMTDQGFSLEEKMILFWHNHFATIYNDVGESRLLFQYIDLLRKHALGNFKTFTKEMSKNGMMLIFLNGYLNHKDSPDENYARELQELFTLGKQESAYTENDVKEAAKVLSGHRISYATPPAYYFDSLAHDTTTKQFSSFYDNATITGRSGADGENELDDLLNMIFSKEEIISKFMVRKIYRFFVHYDIDADIETNIIAPLAQTFISNNWEIKPVLKQLLKSQHFYEVNSRDCLIKNPLDYYVGLMKTTYVDSPPKTDILHHHQRNIMVYYIMNILSMEPSNPPSVAGWQAYRQTPQYHQIWINANTLPNRLLYTDYLFTDYGMYASADVRFKSDVIEFAKKCSNPSNPTTLINFFVLRMLAFDLSAASKSFLKTTLLGGLSGDFYWTTTWNGYIANPTDAIAEGQVRSRLQNVLTQIARQAENQIA
jgi:uncharacterized protein (DUF1800 family)